MEENRFNESLYDGDVDTDDSGVELESEESFEYDISVSPNDYNVNTIFDLINSGVVSIPGFQRNFVWDIKRSSKLIESLLIGVPIPQVFLYEEKKNHFLVIDGQQRLMTIYYFLKKRFPRKEKRYELRTIFEENAGIPDEVLHDNNFFQDFNLKLPEQLPNNPNRFNRKNFATLEEADRVALGFKTIRNIVVKQNDKNQGDAVVFEIFNRLNSGGMNLKPQEIRTSLYHSSFYDMLYRINMNEKWRQLTPKEIPDLNMKDVEILLRGFAMLYMRDVYAPSMTKFLNNFSNKMRIITKEEISKMEQLFHDFIDYIYSLDDTEVFHSSNQRFNISIYEAIFVALTKDGFESKDYTIKHTTLDKIYDLKNDEQFIEATQKSTANTSNVDLRISKAIQML